MGVKTKHSKQKATYAHSKMWAFCASSNCRANAQLGKLAQLSNTRHQRGLWGAGDQTSVKVIPRQKLAETYNHPL